MMYSSLEQRRKSKKKLNNYIYDRKNKVTKKEELMRVIYIFIMLTIGFCIIYITVTCWHNFISLELKSDDVISSIINDTYGTITTEETHTATIRTVTQRPGQIPVFYNVFSSPSKVSLSKSIVKEQISLLLKNHDLFVRSIGVPFEVNNATLIRHDSEGDEAGTLNILWQHCRKHTTDKVVYIHNKGSFHTSRANNKLRKFMTRGALSQACMNMPLSCNVCSSRMSPFPYPHSSGNMWAARCEYIQKLIDPLAFAAKMNVVRDELCKNCSCFPFGRFSTEAWVLSHANSMPCDLSTAESFSWSYDGIPEDNYEIKLEPAPRFERKMYEKNQCQNTGKSAEYRLLEYQALYNETVGKSWWGWKFFNSNQANIDVVA